MPLDTLIAQIAYRARLMERALHDPGPWSMVFVSGKLKMAVPAERTALADGIHFTAVFPPLADLPGQASLCLRDEVVSTFDVTASVHGFTVEWAMRGSVVDDARQR